MADVQLRTLRVSAELDASGYVAGARDIATSSDQAAGATRKLGDTVSQTDTRVGNAANGYERLLRTFVTGYNETQRMTTALNTLSRGLDTGAISAERAQAAMTGIIQRYGQLSNAAQVAERFAARGQAEFAQQIMRTNQLLRQQAAMVADNDNPVINAGMTRQFQTANLAAQFQDIAVTSAMGMSPLQIALQQGTQISAALGPNGAAGAVRALGAAFLSIVNPVSLATVGFVAAAAAAIQYLGPLIMQGEAANEKLKAQRDLISEVAEKWGASLPALKAYNDELQRGQDLAKQREGVAAAIDLSWDGARKQVEDFNVEVTDAISKIGLAGADQDMITVQNVWNNLTARVQAGKATFEDVRNTQTTLNLVLRQQGIEVEGLNGLWANLMRTVEEASGRSRRLMGDLNNPLAQHEALVKQGQPYTDAMLKLQEYYRSQHNPVPTFPNGVPTPTARPTNELDGELTETEKRIAALREEAGARADVVSQIQAKQNLLQGQQDEIERLRLEAQLVGASARERATMTAQLQAEQQLRQQGISLLSAEGQAYVANAKAMAAARLEIERQNAAYSSLQQAGGSAIDSLTVGTGSLRDRLKSAADTMLQWIQQLTIANPLKNALFGTNLPTMSDLFSGKPATPAGVTSTASMMVTASTVMINGGVMGGQFPGIPGASLPGASTTSTSSTLASVLGYRPAANVNGVRPDLTAGGLVNSPVSATTAQMSTGSIEQYIRNAAVQRGIDPDVAVRVARSEGGLESWNLQSQAYKNGIQEPSYGPFQLLKGGQGTGYPTGLGNDFMNKTGLDPALAANGPRGVDFALDHASRNGWGAWYGADKAGISRWQGIGTNPGIDNSTTNSISTSMQKLSQSTTSAVKGIDTLGDSSSKVGSTITDSLGKLATPAAVPQVPAVAPTATAPASGGNIFSSLFGGIFKLFGFADGTDYAPGGLAIVGERGRELVNLPRGSQVTPTHKIGPNSEERRRYGPNAMDIGVRVSFDSDSGFRAYVEGVSRRNAEEAARSGIHAYDTMLPDRVNDISMNPHDRMTA